MGLSIIKHDKPAKFFGYFPDAWCTHVEFEGWLEERENFIKLPDYYGPKGKARAHSGEIGQNWLRSVKIGQNWSRLPILDLPRNGEAARAHGCRSLTRDHRAYKLILYYNTICFLFLSIVP